MACPTNGEAYLRRNEQAAFGCHRENTQNGKRKGMDLYTSTSNCSLEKEARNHALRLFLALLVPMELTDFIILGELQLYSHIAVQLNTPSPVQPSKFAV